MLHRKIFSVFIAILFVLSPLKQESVAASPSSPDVSAQPTVDTTNWGNRIDVSIKNAIQETLLGNPARVMDPSFVLTAFTTSADGRWARAVLIPQAVFDGGMESLSAGSIYEILLHKPAATEWKGYLFNTESFEAIHSDVPGDFLVFQESTAALSVEEYQFPWTAGFSWQVTQTWHDENVYDEEMPANSVDFGPRPWGTPEVGVLAASNGTLNVLCDLPTDPHQIWLMITNADGTSGYGHLSKQKFYESSIPDLLGQFVPRGLRLGELFLYVPVESNPALCGFGNGQHLHFVFPARDGLSMYDAAADRDVPANEIGSTFGAEYTSDNFPPVPVTNVCPSIVDWKAEYWNNQSLAGDATICRSDTGIDFNWGSGSPDVWLPADNFSARWTRELSFAAGTYRFHTRSDGGLRLWVDGTLVIDRWFDQNYTEGWVDLTMTAGSHPIKLEYFESGGNALAQFWIDQADQLIYLPYLAKGFSR